VEIRHPTFDSIRIADTGDNVTGAEWLPLFPGYYFLMMTNVLRFLSGNHISTKARSTTSAAGRIAAPLSKPFRRRAGNGVSDTVGALRLALQ
jgi:hypothetical protein